MLERCPRTLVQIVTQCVYDLDGSRDKSNEAVLRASMINSASLAALNAASVPMRGVVCAAAVHIDDEEGSIKPSTFLLSPPSEDDARRSKSRGVFAFLFEQSHVKCVYTSWNGGTAEQMKQAEKVALARAKEVWDAISIRFGAPQLDEDEEGQMEI